MSYATVFREGLFEGRTALVSGGGSGIGRCIAHELAALGAHVVLSGRTEAKLGAVAEEIAAAGGESSVRVCNIRDEESVDALFAGLGREGRPVDMLVNNAGGQFLSRPEAIRPKGWRAVIDTNLNGTFWMCQAAFEHAMKARGGAIVNIVADFWRGMPMMAHTSAARAAVANLGQSLALAWAPFGVRVNAVAPGIIRSSGLKNYPPFVVQQLSDFAKEVPAKRLGTESEVSAAVVFLLSPAAAYITGETVKVDGASSLYRQWAPVADHERLAAYDGFHLAADLPDQLERN